MTGIRRVYIEMDNGNYYEANMPTVKSFDIHRIRHLTDLRSDGYYAGPEDWEDYEIQITFEARDMAIGAKPKLLALEG